MAHIVIDEKRNEKLKDLLIRLSDPSLNLQKQNVRRDVYSEFENIYWQGEDKELYRHLYSDLYATIVSIDNSDTNDINILVQNIRNLCLSYNPLNSKVKGLNIKDSLIKLYDHIALDVNRLEYTKSLNYQHQGSLFTIARQIQDTEKSIEEKISNAVDSVLRDTTQNIAATKESILTESKDEASKMRAEYISILGIFASVVLAFVGNLAFTTSVLSNIHKASIYRTVIVTALVGMITIFVLWLLMDFIKSIHGNSVRKLAYVIIPETVLLLVIIATVVLFRLDYFREESANSLFENTIESTFEEEETNAESSCEENSLPDSNQDQSIGADGACQPI